MWYLVAITNGTLPRSVVEPDQPTIGCFVGRTILSDNFLDSSLRHRGPTGDNSVDGLHINDRGGRLLARLLPRRFRRAHRANGNGLKTVSRFHVTRFHTVVLRVGVYQNKDSTRCATPNDQSSRHLAEKLPNNFQVRVTLMNPILRGRGRPSSKHTVNICTGGYEIGCRP